MPFYSAVGCIVMLTLSLLAAPAATAAQPRGKMPLIGVLELGSPQTPLGCLVAFRQGLRDLGYVEGHNITIAYRYAEGQRDRLSPLAAVLVRLTPDVLWTHSTPAALAAKQATSTIPIVLGVANDLVEQGLVESLERPGGNLTGLELRDVELMGKRLELFKEAVPTISRVAVLVDPSERAHAHVPSNIEAEAQALRVQLQRVEAGDPEAFEAAFAAMVHGGANALMIMDTAFFVKYRPRLLALAARYRLPTISGTRSFAAAGSLLAYGARVADLCKRSAVFTDKILQGATPADLPVERADKFSLVVNLKTAAALGLTIPPTFLYRADEVIK
jgi:putative ABC transport system substrate-binding protein